MLCSMAEESSRPLDCASSCCMPCNAPMVLMKSAGEDEDNSDRRPTCRGQSFDAVGSDWLGVSPIKPYAQSLI